MPTAKFRCTGREERGARQRGYRCVAGVDEVGRGSLFGPVVAAAVVLDPARPIVGLRDSKLLTPERRTVLAAQIRAGASWAVGLADVDEIGELNIYHASLLAMRRAVLALATAPDFLLIDGLGTLDLPCAQRTLVKGDMRVQCIAAASIVAKVHRDELLTRWADEYPGYGLERHKGYPTPAHYAALLRLGPCPQHRRDFGPVRAAQVSA